MLKLMLLRPMWLPTTITAGLLLTALALMVAISYRGFARLEPVHDHLVYVATLQDLRVRLHELLLEDGLSSSLKRESLLGIREDLHSLTVANRNRSEETLGRLRTALAVLSDPSRDLSKALVDSLREIRTVVAAETVARDDSIEDLQRTTALELEVAIGSLVAFPILILLVLYLLRRRILAPLSTLAELMSRLSEQDYRSAPMQELDPILEPLVVNYNHLVERLTELERENQARQESLESQVRAATHALLDQQRDLANAERLASVGEVAAGLAHDLRNPLAGIQVALANLRSETATPEHAERLDLILQEVARVVGILNDVLTRSRHVPEPSVDVCVADSVSGLLSLLRYQLPSGVRVTTDIPADLVYRLPERRTRQAILNLVLNSAAAMSEGEGTITITAAITTGELVITVCDEGTGFPKELLRSGVRPFATGRQQGTGLGLSLVRRFVSDLGGKIDISNREPKGACVTLHIPPVTADV